MKNTDIKNNAEDSKKTMPIALKRGREYMKAFIFIMPAIVVAAFAAGGLYIGKNAVEKEQQTEYISDISVDKDKNVLSDTNGNTGEMKERASEKKALVKAIKAKVDKAKAKSGKPADGVFEGNSVCEKFGYTVSLKVKFKNGDPVAVYDMKLLNNQDSANLPFMNKAWKGIAERIVGNRTSDIDIVSGATYSSNAIINAYFDARNKAVAKQNGEKVQETPVPAPSPSKRPVTVSVKNDKKNKLPEGTIVDGSYKVSEVCEPDEDEDFEKYTMTAVFTFKNGKCIKISDITSNSESNKAYYMKAANGTASDKGVVTQIEGKSAYDNITINAVSGATCSSKTIYRLYIKALEKAARNKEKTPAPQESKKPQTVPVPQESKKPSAAESSTPTSTPASGTDPDPQPTVSPVLIPLNNGVYSETVTVYPDENNEFEEYTIFADVVFEENRLKGIENAVLSDETNRFYYNKALNGTKTKPGLLSQIEARQEGEYDMVSGATCSSKALQQLYLMALDEAKIK